MLNTVTVFAVLCSTLAACAVDDDDGESDTTSNVSDLIVPFAASSSAIINTNGTRAGEVFFNRAGGDSQCGGSPCFAIFDAKNDRMSIYVLYTINNAAPVRQENFGGPGTTRRVPLQNTSFGLQYKACININNGLDHCTDPVQDRTP